MQTATIETPLGTAIIYGDENGISSISIVDETQRPSPIPPVLANAVTEIDEYFKGNRTDFTFKTNAKGTDFQKKVWTQLQSIPSGKTISYLELSKQLGDEKAVRAVAAANSKNPLWIVVPCHRVIGKDGSLTGYAGGLWRKKWLLEHENSLVQQSLF